MKVGACTFDKTTYCLMNISNDDKPPLSHRIIVGKGVLSSVEY
jgi:hypothetical protein